METPKSRNAETPKRGNAEMAKRQNVETSERQNAEASEREEPPALAGGCSARQGNAETSKRPNAETAEDGNAETSKRRNAETAEDRNAETSKRRNAEMVESGSVDARSPASPPTDLPTDPRVFWAAGEDFAALASPSDIPAAPALKIAGPPPFPRSRFPVMGFLATVYEQVSTRAREMTAAESAGG